MEMVVVPPTPLGFKDPPLSSPSPTPELARVASLEQERASSETTIFTIYSMYSDEAIKPSDEAASKHAVTPSLSNFRNSKYAEYQQSLRSTNGGVYNSTSSEGNGRPHSKYVSATDIPARTSVISNGSVHLPYLDERPLSTHARSAGLRDHVHKSSDTLRSSKFKDLPQAPNNTNRASHVPSDMSHPRQPILTHSRPSSIHSISRNGNSPTPPFRGMPTPPRSTPDLLSPPKTTGSIKSPGSKSSLVPSEGEEVDAFYVRNTYAELEMTGVKGDGYEEGVERTRARTNGSRSSMMREEEAVDDGSEKTRELSHKELNTLASLDRYVIFFTAPLIVRIMIYGPAMVSSQ